MGVAAVAGAVVPCAVSCKTGQNADSAKVSVVLDDAEDELELFQLDVETGVAEDGELTAHVEWHSMWQLYYYVPSAMYVVINGKTYTARSETNKKGFLYQSFSVNGATLSMPDEMIPYNAEIVIHIVSLVESSYEDAVELANTEENGTIYYEGGSTGALQFDMVTSTAKPTVPTTDPRTWTDNQWPKVDGAISVSKGEEVAFSTNIAADLATAEITGTLGLTVSLGYYATNRASDGSFLSNEYTHNALDVKGSSSKECSATLESLYYGDKPLDWHLYRTGPWSQYIIIVDAPYEGGKWAAADGKTQPITGVFHFYRSIREDLEDREAGVEFLIGQLTEA